MAFSLMIYRPNFVQMITTHRIDHGPSNFVQIFIYGSGRMVSRRVENTEGKGEIARCEQFLHFPTVFSKDLYC